MAAGRGFLGTSLKNWGKKVIANTDSEIAENIKPELFSNSVDPLLNK
jgi:hypothetical protein